MKDTKTKILVGLALVFPPILAFAQSAETESTSVPFATKTVKPNVPYEFAATEGEVTVLFRLSPQGQPVDIEVESATNSAYADSVQEAVRRWRFAGVDTDPKWTEVRYRLPVVFTDGR